MKLSEKLVNLRKQQLMTQEELAEKLNVSRQAISRWESGTASPDAGNILQLSKLFRVTTDYLLNDEYQSDNDLPKVKEVREDQMNLILFYLVALEVMVLLIQFVTTVILKNPFFACTSFLLFVLPLVGFEVSFRKGAESATSRTKNFRRRYYKISSWLGLYFPIRMLMYVVAALYPGPVWGLVFEIVVLAVYMSAALCVNLTIDKHNLPVN